MSILKKTDLVVFRRKWISSTPRVSRIHQVLLRLPPSISYQHDFFNRNVVEARNATVRAWLDHLKNGTKLGTYHGSILSIYKVLWITSLSERPNKPPTECPSWTAQLMWQTTRNRTPQCPYESGEDLNHLFFFLILLTLPHEIVVCVCGVLFCFYAHS